MLTIGSLYSGIAGLELGVLAAFVEASIPARIAWQCEIDPFCLRVLAHHFPDVTRFRDVATVSHPPRVDVLCFGFACTDVSSAGLGKGLGIETRSGFTLHHALRIVDEIAPRYLVIENVASGAKRWLPRVVQELGDRGYRSRAVPVGAVDVGAPHLRRRIFVVADLGPERRAGRGEAAGRQEGAGAGTRGGGGAVADASGGGLSGPDDGGERGGDGDARGGPGPSELADPRQRHAGQRGLLGGSLPNPFGVVVRQQHGRSGWQSGPAARKPRDDGAELADAGGARLEVIGEQPSRRVARSAAERSGAPRADVADAAESRREGAHGAERQGCAVLPERRSDAPRDGRAPQSGMGTDPHRLPFDVARRPFPSGRGQAQHPWEPPRTIPRGVKVADRPAKLRACGNVAMSQCALIAGRVLVWLVGAGS